MSFPLLSIVVFLPAAGGLLLLLLRKENEGEARALSFLISLVTFVASLPLFFGFDNSSAALQFAETRPWVPALGIQYKIGVDGISLMLILLTTFLTPIAILSAWKAVEDRVKAYYAALLFLETGMLGVFVAMDLVLFYVFWEAMLIPMYLLIGIWGGPRRIYAAMKFFVYTMVGSLFMFLAILYLYMAVPAHTFDVEVLARTLSNAETRLAFGAQMALFLAFGLSFAIKVPMWPLHTWLPDAHVEAPTAGSVILAGVLLKMGTYGFLRFAIPFFPEASRAAMPVISILAVVGILYGALMAMAQEDIKKLIAYSSVSHLGYVMLGIFAFNAHGIQGGLYQMLNHGLSTGALFLLVGAIYERTHTRDVNAYGGFAKLVPVYAVCLMIVTLSSIGLPGLNGFVGEFLILAGAFKADKLYAVLATGGVVLGAVYMLGLYQKMMLGPLRGAAASAAAGAPAPAHGAEVAAATPGAEPAAGAHAAPIADLTARELCYLVPVIAMCFVLGLFPNLFLRTMDASVQLLLSRL
ncbi:MAG: NADH-quinone oxidoreductase subunit M [Planctomycetes bacterium]|nr:NADH-quinone oxidoreductase subunit M [Planctomycetota bacterium]